MGNYLCQLSTISVIDVVGADADTIVHNVTTNAVKPLQVGQGCETFITDVRGKTIGHVFLYRLEDRLRLIGAAGQSERIAAHIDRYTIREDATPVVRDQEFTAFVASPNQEDLFGTTKFDHVEPAWINAKIDGVDFPVYQLTWIGTGSTVCLVPADQAIEVPSQLHARSVEIAGEDRFHSLRIVAGFPWYGIDLDETNLPQEADRDDMAISFNKGCYLGQETVARLDALGQVQKKLVRWQVDCLAKVGSKLSADGKIVGRLTSVARQDDSFMAIGMARRSHFEPGSIATGAEESTDKEFTGIVVA